MVLRSSTSFKKMSAGHDGGVEICSPFPCSKFCGETVHGLLFDSSYQASPPPHTYTFIYLCYSFQQSHRLQNGKLLDSSIKKTEACEKSGLVFFSESLKTNAMNIIFHVTYLTCTHSTYYTNTVLKSLTNYLQYLVPQTLKKCPTSY